MSWEWNDETDVLMHHGIIGQKWGIRRYQNLDGTLTEVGLQRYRSKKALVKDIRNDFAKAKNRSERNELAARWNKSISEANVDIFELDKYDRNNRVNTRYFDSARRRRKSEAVNEVVLNNNDLLKKAKQYQRDVNAIYNSMSDAEKQFLVSKRHGIKKNLIEDLDKAVNYVRTGTAFIEKYRNKPIGFLYIQRFDNSGNVVIGTRSGDQYRRKGYAQRNIQKAKDWLDSNDYGTVRLQWLAYKANIPSQDLAIKSGFKADPFNSMAKYDYDDTIFVLDKKK